MKILKLNQVTGCSLKTLDDYKTNMIENDDNIDSTYIYTYILSFNIMS